MLLMDGGMLAAETFADSLHLIHPSVLWIVEAELQKRLEPAAFLLAFVVMGALISIAAGIIVHRYLEKPLVKIAHRVSDAVVPPWRRANA
jgi:peptidoglycan/LPS O-acetylase OafA/YrhL